MIRQALESLATSYANETLAKGKKVKQTEQIQARIVRKIILQADRI